MFKMRPLGRKGKKKGLTVTIRIRHDNISCSKLDEKLLYKFQRGVDADGQWGLCVYSAEAPPLSVGRETYLVHVYAKVKGILGVIRNRGHG
jgi:hypothetical protein